MQVLLAHTLYKSFIVLCRIRSDRTSRSTTIGFSWTPFLQSVFQKMHIWSKISASIKQMKFLMLTNGYHLSFDKIGEIIFLPMTVHINESLVANILSFAEVSNIEGVHIKMDTSKEKIINVHMQYRRIIHFRAFEEGIFYTNLDDLSMVTNHINTSINPYSFFPP